MDRRTLLLASLSAATVFGLTTPVLTTQVVGKPARRQAESKEKDAAAAPEPVNEAVRAFSALDLGADGRASCLVVANAATVDGKPGPALWQAGHAADGALFVGSAIKTFILAEFLRQQEADKVSVGAQAVIDDSVRSLSSPVFLNLTGRTPYVSILEAMITHSDNTATDVALAAVGPANVRGLIQKAGLSKTRIPDSTRALFGWLAGNAPGVDPGWQGLQAIAANPAPAGSRSPFAGGGPTMQSSASDLVNWHRAALAGRFFERPESLTQYRRIMAMADALPQVVPQDVMAWGKGGSIDWAGFHCLCLAGQMVTAKGPATFCFTINWRGADADKSRVFDAYKDSIRRVLAETAVAAGN